MVPYDAASMPSASSLPFGLGGKQSKEQKEEDFEEKRSQLEQRMAVVEQGLSRCGIRVERLGTDEVVELFYKIFNPGETEKPIKIS